MPAIFETACRPLAREVERRTISPREVEPGGWYGEGDLLLATRRTMLTVRLREGASCHWLDLRAREPRWHVAVPRIDLARGSVEDLPRDARAIAARPRRVESPRRRRRARTRRDPAQLELPLVEHADAVRDEKRDAIARLIDDVPARCLGAASPARARWHWELLLFFDQGGEPAIELLESTPALGFALALAPLFCDAPSPPLEEVLAWRQSRIAALLGLPASRRGVRALRKLELGELDVVTMLAVRRLLRDERVLARVSHLPRLSRALVRVGRSPEGFLALGRELQLALLDPRRGPRLAGHYEHVVHRMRQLRERGYALPETLRSARHAAVVERSMDALVDELGSLDAPDAVAPPPFPGIPGVIEPLRCAGEFHVEGESMRNCVRTYARAAMAGDVAIYRVLRPERATVSLVRCSPTRWRIGELYAAANTPVSTRTRREVERWLERWCPPERAAATATAQAPDEEAMYGYEGPPPFDADEAFGELAPRLEAAWPDDAPF